MSTETGVGTPPKHEPINSFEHIGDVITNSLAMLYSTLYSSGAICVGLVCWKYYPAVVRYRHTHVLRYRRNQLQLRRWVFSTPHMPKWDKRYLQRLDLPLQSMPPQAGAAPLRISCTRTSTATFAGGETLHRENTFLDEVKKLNQQFFTHPQHHNADEIRMAVREASKRARTVVVKVDTPDSVRSIQAGHEVWWLSADEARRESFSNFWIVAFAIARIFQDLFEMPDMPDFIV